MGWLRPAVLGAAFTAAALLGVWFAVDQLREWARQERFVLQCQETWKAHPEPCREMYRKYFP